jgi:diaminohydroxyphosphoribosylaminopyrimidine deaminase/5-amino-6-(5-phosphoribosylamino)uracil reductase
VGAVIVKNNKIIGQGYHHKAGADHAEIVAIKSIKDKAKLKGAELYVTLEPCSHFGKTPPCVDEIINSGIKKVFVGMSDPFKKVNGRGIVKLKKAGIKVELLNVKSDLYKKIIQINQPFIKHSHLGLPYVILKAAVSLDGKMATRTGDSKWITNQRSRIDARLERSLCDAVLVGSGTVKADNPELAPHGKFKTKKLLRVIIDNDLSTSPKARIYRDNNVVILTTNTASPRRVSEFKKANINLKIFKTKTKIEIKNLLKYLSSLGVQKLFVEGGANVHGSFYDAYLKNSKLVDEIIFYVAPVIIGGKNAVGAFAGEGNGRIVKIERFKDFKIRRIDCDLKITGILNKY